MGMSELDHKKLKYHVKDLGFLFILDFSMDQYTKPLYIKLL